MATKLPFGLKKGTATGGEWIKNGNGNVTSWLSNRSMLKFLTFEIEQESFNSSVHAEGASS